MWKEVVSLAAAAGAAYVLRSEYEKKHFSAEVTEIISPKPEKDRGLIFLSDLHNNEFGRDNGELVAAIHYLHPDAVLSGGNVMICRRRRDIKVPLKLFRQLAASYPVYCGNRNHKNRTMRERNLYGDLYEEYRDATTAMGARCLGDSFASLGRGPRIADLDLSPCFYRKAPYQKVPLMSEGYMGRKLGKRPSVCKEEPFTTFLTHPPLHFNSYTCWGVDPTLVGHFHGGIIRIPGLGGVMTPQYQFFLPWCVGDFERNGKRMIVSQGLETHSINIRLNNGPRPVLIRLKRA